MTVPALVESHQPPKRRQRRGERPVGRALEPMAVQGDQQPATAALIEVGQGQAAALE
jgi:hypothetical protein